MSDSTDSNGSVIFVAEQHTVRVQVHQPGDPTVIPETQQFSIPETQDDTPTSSSNTTPEAVVIPETQGDNLRQNTDKKIILLVYTCENSLVKQVPLWSFRKALRAKNLKKCTSLVHSKYSRYSKRAYKHKQNTIRSQKTLMLRKTIIFIVILHPRHPAVTWNSRLRT